MCNFFPQGYISNFKLFFFFFSNFKLLIVKTARLRKVYTEELSCHFTVFVCLAMLMCLPRK